MRLFGIIMSKNHQRPKGDIVFTLVLNTPATAGQKLAVLGPQRPGLLRRHREPLNVKKIYIKKEKRKLSSQPVHQWQANSGNEAYLLCHRLFGKVVQHSVVEILVGDAPRLLQEVPAAGVDGMHILAGFHTTHPGVEMDAHLRREQKLGTLIP